MTYTVPRMSTIGDKYILTGSGRSDHDRLRIISEIHDDRTRELLLPAGLAPQKDLKEPMNRPVTLAGYYFKLAQYEQQGVDRAGKHKVWAAPAIIGKSLILVPEETLQDSVGNRWLYFGIAIAVVSVGIALTLAILSWRYRRMDRRILAEAWTDGNGESVADKSVRTAHPVLA